MDRRTASTFVVRVVAIAAALLVTASCTTSRERTVAFTAPYSLKGDEIYIGLASIDCRICIRRIEATCALGRRSMRASASLTIRIRRSPASTCVPMSTSAKVSVSDAPARDSAAFAMRSAMTRARSPAGWV